MQLFNINTAKMLQATNFAGYGRTIKPCMEITFGISVI